MARQRSLTTETNLAKVQTNLATIQIRPTPREIAQCYHLIPFKALRWLDMPCLTNADQTLLRNFERSLTKLG
ncbi:hypothetical protein E4U12_006505 [Claviceps purpurea]|nr:hypothetical protein E4U12_006505 [Claviceps purpurea]